MNIKYNQKFMYPLIKARLCMVLAALLMAIVALGATYRPNSQVKSYITVRAAAKSSSAEVARIYVSETFEVVEIQNGWGKVVTESGHKGYVNAKFIEKVPEAAVVADTKALSRLNVYDLHWMVWLILGLLIAIFLMQKLDDEGSMGVWVMPVLWLLLGVSEVAYILLCKDQFWTTRDLGWLAILIAVIVFAVGAVYQTGSMIGFARTYSEDNAAFGIWSVPVCAVAALVLAFVAPKYIYIPFFLFLLAQLWQAAVIFRTVYSYQGAGLATVSAIGYLFGMLGTIVVATLLVVLVIVLLVGLFCLRLVLAMLDSDSNIRLTHSWGSYFTDQYGNQWEHIGGNTYQRS